MIKVNGYVRIANKKGAVARAQEVTLFIIGNWSKICQKLSAAFASAPVSSACNL